MQSWRGSLIESGVSVLLGVVIGFINHSLIFPLVGITVSVGENIQIAAMCSAVSFLEKLAVRRYFNSKEGF